MKTNFFTSYVVTACKIYFETLYFTPANCVLFRDCQEFSNLEPFHASFEHLVCFSPHKHAEIMKQTKGKTKRINICE